MEDTSFQILPSTIEAIRVVVTSDAWEQFFIPSLLNMKEDWAKKLMDPSKERKDEYPDDFIRGCFQTIEVFLTLPKALIQEFDADQERREQASEQRDAYALRVSLGKVGPYADSVTTTRREYDD